MTREYPIRVDVSGIVDAPGPVETEATVYLPDRIDQALTVMFAYPGGGASRGYYDIRELPAYSQAEHHVADGHIFVACDHLGIGGSTPVDPFALTFETMAAANHRTASTIIEKLRSGCLLDGIGPIEVARVVGMGHSMGGCLLIVQQATHGTFDGICVLGYGVRSSFPTPDGTRVTLPAPARGDLQATTETMIQILENVDVSYAFYTPDDDPALVEADTQLPGSPSMPPWKAAVGPACAASMMGEGIITEEAAAIDVPVLVACGETDVVTDPWMEPSWYRNSRDIAVFVAPRMAHVHNFAQTRQSLWQRVSSFAGGVAARR